MSEQSRTHQDPTTPRGRARRSSRTARIVTTSLVAGGIAVAGGTAVAATGEADARAATAVAAATSTGPDLTADRQAEQTRTASEVAVDRVVTPGPTPAAPAAEAAAGPRQGPAVDPVLVPADGTAPATDPGPADDVAADAFYAAGYTYDDAVALAAVWNVDTWQAKVLGGGKLTAGEELPLAPGSSAPADPVDDDAVAVDAFFAAGYTYDDAVALAAAWGVDSWEAKVLGGAKLAAGEALPVAPGSSAPAPADPASGESAAVDAFFAAGYTYDDAVELGQLWSLDPYQAKVTGGEQLLTGATLPVAP